MNFTKPAIEVAAAGTDQLGESPIWGSMLAVRPGVQGLPESRFAG